MKKYTLLSLLIILVGIFLSVGFLVFSFKKNIPSKMGYFTEENSAIPVRESENESLRDISLENDSDAGNKNLTPENEEFEVEDQAFVENQTPFISQAPFGVWDELHDEACEEASIIIANGFLNNVKEISNQKAEKEILALVDWQMKEYGEHKDLILKEIQSMALGFYDNEFEISDDINEDAFKKILANDKIIIAPVAGREIGNPFFTPPGPLYHVLVIIGYDEEAGEFITNDPGTKRGAGFRYSYEILLESIHDFPGKKEEILEGKARVLILTNTN
ncbi:MAG: hypothetical protein PF549_00795 [Patescibacteria group bacterium]|jgi:hypothetical protein|nr:hypothetical protein [Patescibacteria group bacterium]